MKSKLRLLVVIVSTIVMSLLIVACDREKPKLHTPSSADVIPTHNTITVSNVQGVVSIDAVEFSLGGTNWQSEPLFTDLSPNTEYKVYIRQKATAEHSASDSLIKEVTTLKADQAVPAVSFVQSDKLITLVGVTDAMEVAFDGVNFGSETSHTYQTNGNKTISVRYKETNQANQSDAQVIEVNISNFYGGLGTSEKPYQIKNFGHLQLMTGSFYFELVDDIVFPAAPLTNVISLGSARQFDGNGKKFIDPVMSYENIARSGIFGQCVGTIRNLTVENAVMNVKANNDSHFGILVGELLNGDIINVHVNGVINIESDIPAFSGSRVNVGGLVGTMTGSGNFTGNSILNSSADIVINCTTTAGGSGHVAIGGLAGRGQILSILNSYAEVELNITDGFRRVTAGGLAGGEEGAGGLSTIINVENSYSIGNMVVQGEGWLSSDMIIAGGLVGRTSGVITKSYSSVDISVAATNQNIVIGGIVGIALRANDPIIENTFFAGSIVTNLQITNGTFVEMLASIATNPPRPNSIANSFHIDTIGLSVVADNSTAVSEALLKSITWQRENMNFDEEIWNLVDGELPVLK